jgi:hypothetical protein
VVLKSESVSYLPQDWQSPAVLLHRREMLFQFVQSFAGQIVTPPLAVYLAKKQMNDYTVGGVERH